MISLRADWPKYVAASAGGVASALGVAVLAGWYAHYIPLIQILPNLAPMQRMTALGIVLSGLALLLLSAPRKRSGQVLALIVLSISALVVLESALDVNVGIDQLLGRDYVQVRTSHPGRMSPVTALGLLATSLALMALSKSKRARYAPAIAGILGSLVVAVGAIGVFAYGVGNNEAFGWGHFTRVALHTAAGLSLLGTGTFALAWRESGLSRSTTGWLPLSIGLGLTTGAVGMWQALMVHEERQLKLLSYTVLVCGIVGAVLVAIAVSQAQRARLRSRQLEEGKEAFERLFEASPDALLVTDLSGRIVSANHRVQSVFGYTPDEIFGAPIESLIPIPLRDLHRAHRESYYASPRARPMGRGLDLKARRKDGREFPVEVSLGPLHSGSGLQVLAAAHDITERKRAEEELRQSEERFRNVFERSPLGLVLVYPDYRMMTVNESMRQMLGYSGEELNGLSPLDITYPEDREESNRLAQRLFQGEIPFYKIEKRYVKKSGEIIWTTLTVTSLRDRAGNFLYSLGMIEDITARKQAEEALRQSEERFRGVFENSPLGLSLVRPDHGIEKVNASLQRMLGYSEDELSRLRPDDVTYRDDLQESMVLMQRLFSGEIPSYQIEKRYVKKSGEIVWATLTATALRDREGRLLYALGMIEDITARKRAEEALRQSEERFRGVIEQGPIGITLMDRDYRLIKVNAALCRMLGYSEDELTGMTPLDFTHPDDRQPTVDLVERLFTAEVPMRKMEKRYIKKNGEVIWGSVTASVIHDSHGKPLYGMGMIEDVSERKRAEEELRTLTQRLSLATRIASIGVWDWDLRTNLEVWDDASFEMFGLPKVNPVSHEEFIAHVHPDDVSKVRATTETAIREKTQQTMEYRVFRSDGSERQLSVAAGPVLDEDGRVVRVVGTAIDITDRKRAEDELQTLTQRLSLATRSASTGVWEFSLDSNLAIWDDMMFQIFGIPKKAQVPREDWASMMHPDDRARAEAFMDAIIHGRTQQTLECRITRPDGSPRYLFAAGGPVVDGHGRVTGVVGIVQDVTERKQLELDLEAAREQAISSARLSALGMMAGGVAHEINNPLSIIHAMASDLAEMAEERRSVPPQLLARKSQAIRETAERIAKIVKSLRQISREGTGDPFRPTRLAKIVADTLEICRAKFKAHNVELLLPRIIPNVSVSCREVQIAQALLNLLQNAFDAVLEQEGERWVQLEVEVAGGAVTFSVTDSGPGIPAEIRSRVMEPFFTTKAVGKGTGLGLSLSKTIAEDHGGRLEYSEDRGHTRFALVLPLATRAEAA